MPLAPFRELLILVIDTGHNILKVLRLPLSSCVFGNQKATDCHMHHCVRIPFGKDAHFGCSEVATSILNSKKSPTLHLMTGALKFDAAS